MSEMVVELWQVAVFIVGICFLILTIYLVGVLQNVSRAMDQVRTLISANAENITAITKELAAVTENAASITDDLSEGMEDMNEALESVRKTTQMVEETMEMSKENIILPLMGLLNLGQGMKSIAGILHRDKK